MKSSLPDIESPVDNLIRTDLFPLVDTKAEAEIEGRVHLLLAEEGSEEDAHRFHLFEKIQSLLRGDVVGWSLFQNTGGGFPVLRQQFEEGADALRVGLFKRHALRQPGKGKLPAQSPVEFVL